MKEYSELDLNKMVAELEGLPFSVSESNKCVTLPNQYCNDNKCDFVYKPLTQKGRLFDLMVKYKVSINRCFYYVEIDCGEFYNQQPFKSDLEIPRAIIMCILKSENII